MKSRFFALLVVLSPVIAFAHHPFDSEFDAKAPLQVTATVVKVNWSEPHVIIDANVKDETGQSKSWALEAGSPAELNKKGWAKNTLKPGDKIEVHAYRAKNEPYRAAVRTVKLSDGKELSAASDDQGPKK